MLVDIDGGSAIMLMALWLWMRRATEQGRILITGFVAISQVAHFDNEVTFV